MPKKVIYWEWEEAFDKFGFDDGDGPNFTDEVASFLRGLGYEVECDHWGIHNYMIFKVEGSDGTDLLEGVEVGYDNPRQYLPAYLVEQLDHQFGG